MNEYASSEDVLMISAIVQKSEMRIAHPVSLRVQPLTIDEALARGLKIPTVESNWDIKENSSEQRRRIPIRAKGKHEIYNIIHHYNFNAMHSRRW